MGRWSARIRLGALVILFACAALEAAAQGATEERVFRITADGKSIGTEILRIAETDAGAVAVEWRADTRWPGFLWPKVFERAGREEWDKERLIGMQATIAQQGRKRTVSVVRSDKGIALSDGASSTPLPPKTLTSAFWRLPACWPDAEISFVDLETGQATKGQLRRLSDATTKIEGKETPCVRLRLVGDGAVDLWFDTSRRLVRREYSRDGRLIVVHLVAMRK